MKDGTQAVGCWEVCLNDTYTLLFILGKPWLNIPVKLQTFETTDGKCFFKVCSCVLRTTPPGDHHVFSNLLYLACSVLLSPHSKELLSMYVWTISSPATTNPQTHSHVCQEAILSLLELEFHFVICYPGSHFLHNMNGNESTSEIVHREAICPHKSTCCRCSSGLRYGMLQHLIECLV
jgi:hypothetical protein